MKSIAIVVMFGVAACQRTHELHVLLGPNADTPSAGFLCKQDADPGKLLLERSDVFDGQSVNVNLVVDIVSLGGHLPGCRGEEIVASCTPGTCSLAVARADRYCVPITFHVSLAISDRAALMREVTAELAKQPITSDAPNGPVLLRAVATSQSCDDIHAGAIDPSLAVGCAYSCPAVLDDIAGPISLSLDVLDDQCESTVRACAGFQN